MLEDRWLLWKYKQGSSDALERIYEKYETYLFSVALSLLNNTHAAEDVLHDVFVMLVTSANTIKLHGNFKAYLATCVVNLARNRIKKRQREPGSWHENEPAAPANWEPESPVIQKEEAVRLNRAMSQLPYEQREVVTLHLQGGMKFTRIAAMSGTSVNTIRSRYRYGLEKLRSLLDDEVMK